MRNYMDAKSFLYSDFFSFDKPVQNMAGYASRKALDAFSTRLVEYRIEHNLTQTALAHELGISQSMVSQYEEGTNNVSIKRMCEICEKIGVRINVSFSAANAPTEYDIGGDPVASDFSAA